MPALTAQHAPLLVVYTAAFLQRSAALYAKNMSALLTGIPSGLLTAFYGGSVWLRLVSCICMVIVNTVCWTGDAASDRWQKQRPNWVCMAVTDHGNLFGVIDTTRPVKVGKPIIGCEVYVVISRPPQNNEKS